MLQPVHAQLRVDNGEAVYSHLARSGSVAKAGGSRSCQIFDVLGRGTRPGYQLDLPHLVESLLVTQFPRRVDRTDDRAQILIGPEIVGVDDGGILPSRTGNPDLTTTRGLD